MIDQILCSMVQQLLTRGRDLMLYLLLGAQLCFIVSSAMSMERDIALPLLELEDIGVILKIFEEKRGLTLEKLTEIFSQFFSPHDEYLHQFNGAKQRKMETLTPDTWINQEPRFRIATIEAFTEVLNTITPNNVTLKRAYDQFLPLLTNDELHKLLVLAIRDQRNSLAERLVNRNVIRLGNYAFEPFTETIRQGNNRLLRIMLNQLDFEEKRQAMMGGDGLLLHLAVYHERVETVRYLLELLGEMEHFWKTHDAGRYPTMPTYHKSYFLNELWSPGDEPGKSPLHFAAERGLVDVIELLIQHGARLTVADTEGLRPIHYAILHNKFSAGISLARFQLLMETDPREMAPNFEAIISVLHSEAQNMRAIMAARQLRGDDSPRERPRRHDDEGESNSSDDDMQSHIDYLREHE
jgi:hypothetical protein